MTVKALNGDTAEAFDLILEKKYAMAILQEKKTVEYRKWSKFYTSRFFKRLSPEVENKEINVVHFHDYNNTWFLDVQITAPTGIYLIDEGGIADFLEYCKEYDMAALLRRNREQDLSYEEAGLIIMIPIWGIINTNLCPLSDLANNKFVKLQDHIKPWDFQMHLSDEDNRYKRPW
jgi:hypothetical protein